MPERRVRRLLLVPHTHTDVGYTAAPGTVAAWQADFLRRAVALAERDAAFRWTCEGFWGVEQFLACATPAEEARFIAQVRAGRIGLSASWLNLTELPDAELHMELVARAARWCAGKGLPLSCAMTADVNGHGPGLGAALARHGVRFLFACVHGHHGLSPLFRRQQACWWEPAEGARLLVWNGEHYHLGNELGMAPGAVSSYQIKDDQSAADIFGDAWPVALKRIPRYLDALEQAGHPLDFAPLMISGLRTDNSPPSARLLEQVERWRREGDASIEIRLVSLEEVLVELEQAGGDWPVHHGDWPDWWSDGAASRPAGVRQFRQALRERRLCRAGEALAGPPADLVRHAAEERELETCLGLYAEHTFSHAASVSQPWDLRVQRIAAAKDAQAARALDLCAGRLARLRRALGEALPRPGLAPRWRVLNPWPRAWEGPVLLAVEHYELCELGLDRPQRLLDDSGRERPCQRVPEGFLTWLALPAGGESRLELVRDEHPPGSLRPDSLLPADRIDDLAFHASARHWPGSERGLATTCGRLEWDPVKGVTSLCDGADRQMLGPESWPPFTLIHELTPCHLPEEACSSRAVMGRNRKGVHVRRSQSTWGRLLRRESGVVFEEMQVELAAPSCAWAALVLRLYHAAPRLDLELRLHKESRWEAENLYLSLPRPAGMLWVDKGGIALRPGLDQLPGTLIDYTSVGTGYAIEGAGLAVAMPDQHLLQLGPLEHGPRRLAQPPCPQEGPLLAWLMTNYWETNFAAELGGFHAFRYSLHWGAACQEPRAALALAGRAWEEVLSLRIDEEAS